MSLKSILNYSSRKVYSKRIFFYFVLTADPHVNANTALGVPQVIKSLPDEIHKRSGTLHPPCGSDWLSVLHPSSSLSLASSPLRDSLGVPGWFEGATSPGTGDPIPPFKVLGQG